jgi:hypothetical protein
MGNRRGRRPAPPLTVELVLSWADAHRARTGEWPLTRSGPVAGQDGETWQAINVALRLGRRGLPGGDSLAGLLEHARGVPIRRGWSFRGWYKRRA